MNEPVAIILAAGKGTRMETDLPKVLVEICGRPMLHYVVDALRVGGIRQMIAVVGYRSELVRSALADQPDVAFVDQTQQLGTGHAVMVCRDALAGHDGPVFVVTGDSPLLQPDSVRKLLDEFHREQPACIVGTTHKVDPTGLGRIVRNTEGRFLGIVEEKDATPDQRKITEVNMSTYVFNCADLMSAVDHLTTVNAQSEYYITDGPGILKQKGKDVRALPVLKPCEALGVNTLQDLETVEAALNELRGPVRP